MTLDDVIFIMLHIMTRHVARQLPKQEVLSSAKYNSPLPVDEKNEAGSEDKKDDKIIGEADQLSEKEAKKINQAAELVQKHYLELNKDSDVSVEKLLDVFLERN